MKILIISHGIPSANDPQWGCFELDQARALRALGHKVVMMATDGRLRIMHRKWGVTHSVIDGIDAYNIYLLPLGILLYFNLRHWVRQWMALFLFKRICEHHWTPDIIYAHYMVGMSEMAIVKKHFPTIPIVGIEHWSVLNQPVLPNNIIAYGKIAYNTIDRLLAVSESLKSQIKKHFNKDAEVVYDMLGEEFVGNKPDKRERQRDFRFVSVGSLIYRKGYDLLIEAFCDSGLMANNCSVTIIGDGEDYSKLQQIIDSNGLGKCVTLTGRKNKQEIIEILRNCDAFVLASRAETFGVVYIEAMSQGLPVIATICGGPEEFVDEGNGILIPTDDKKSLMSAMVKMYEEYDRFDNAKIAMDINNRFAPNVIATRLEQIFKEEIEKKHQK